MNPGKHHAQPLLRVENLRVAFQGRKGVARAVEGVSFRVDAGETVCLVGESGCGKTVTSLSILGLIAQPPGQILSGRILLDGSDLLRLTEEEMQGIRGNRIAMIFQEPLTSLNPVFTIGDQIQEAMRIHKPWSREEIRRRTLELLEATGIPFPEDRLRDYPHQLSGGQRQRVMIAMALACEPQLIIADEPTTALDVTIQAQILALFRSLQRQRRLSLLYITHDLGVVAGIAHRVYVMYAGLIVEEGTAHQIFFRPAHPYTQALLASLPVRSKRGERLQSIPGSVPDPALRPAGCPFHPRCPHALSSCRGALPEMEELEEEHRSRCPVLLKAWRKNHG